MTIQTAVLIETLVELGMMSASCNIFSPRSCAVTRKIIPVLPGRRIARNTGGALPRHSFPGGKVPILLTTEEMPCFCIWGIKLKIILKF
jgi:hypothetical protein